MAIRIALGTQSADILKTVLGRMVVMILAGCFTGIAATLAVSRWIAASLYGVSAADPALLMISGIALVLAAATAACLPVWRAISANPADTLRLDA